MVKLRSSSLSWAGVKRVRWRFCLAADDDDELLTDDDVQAAPSDAAAAAAAAADLPSTSTSLSTP